ncbi:MAG: thiamine-phosphate kinase [Halioglobus sp.]|nr:thiamine-phosphate kinase [Halioglobus sp.]
MPDDEFSLIERYFSGLDKGDSVALGVGDDCAILRLETGEQLLTSVDTQVDGVHFPSGTPPQHVAFRVVSAAVSDLAAMGARPLGMTLAVTLPEADGVWLARFREGLAAAVSEYSLPLVGGDTTRGPLCLSVQVMGAVPVGKAIKRSGAQVGDTLCVSGHLGDGAGGLAVLEGRWRPGHAHAAYLEQRFYRPRARVELGCQLRDDATAAIDISDGLLADIGHMAAASGVGLKLEPDSVPLSAALLSHGSRDTALRWALAGGDDYELCFCLPRGHELPAGTTCIGEVVAGEGVDCGDNIDIVSGYQHFSDSAPR